MEFALCNTISKLNTREEKKKKKIRGASGSKELGANWLVTKERNANKKEKEKERFGKPPNSPICLVVKRKDF